MMKSRSKKALGIVGVVAGAALGVALTVGIPSTSQMVDIWRKVGTTVSTYPTSLNVSVGGTLDVTGTSTFAQSVDGLVVGGTFSVSSTGTPTTIYTNTTGKKYCDADTAYVYAKSSAFSPSLQLSIGTTTSGTLPTANVIATSTIATTTTQVVKGATGNSFVLGNDETLNVLFDDITNAEASSTYFGNWDFEAGVWCQDLSI